MREQEAIILPHAGVVAICFSDKVFIEPCDVESGRLLQAMAIKRIADCALILMALPLLAPLFILIALMIKLDSRGSVFFTQKRTGLNGKPFMIYKFRSMTQGACQGDQTRQSRKNDRRHTTVGRILRATSLDELPQLINVLKGDMSLIGPRPHMVEHDHLFNEMAMGYAQRFRMRPGLTGLAQVYGCRGQIHSQADIQHRTDYDNTYINHWSLRQDMRILMHTLAVVFKRTNAH